MLINIITLFPSVFQSLFDASILFRARERGIINIRYIDLRSFGIGSHKTADDTPYGGGGGMVMKPEPICDALDSIGDNRGHVILTTPRGSLFSEKNALSLSKRNILTIICGHYEGVDERVSELFVDEEISIGDYVLTGGEIPAMVIIDAVARLIPDVLGSDTLASGDSHYNGLLEHPQYTRPRKFMGKKVPDILLSGNHKEISKWRRKMALMVTRDKRPDLFEKVKFTDQDIALLEEDE